MATNNYIPLFVLFKNHSPSGDSYGNQCFWLLSYQSYQL